MANIKDLASLKKYSPEIDAELKALFAKYGLKMNKRRAKIGSGIIDYKIELTYTTEAGESAHEIAWKKYAAFEGLKPEWLGQSVRMNGQEWTICGFEPKRRRYPVMASNNATGKVMLWTTEGVIQAFKLKELSAK